MTRLIQHDGWALDKGYGKFPIEGDLNSIHNDIFEAIGSGNDAVISDGTGWWVKDDSKGGEDGWDGPYDEKAEAIDAMGLPDPEDAEVGLGKLLAKRCTEGCKYKVVYPRGTNRPSLRAQWTGDNGQSMQAHADFDDEVELCRAYEEVLEGRFMPSIVEDLLTLVRLANKHEVTATT